MAKKYTAVENSKRQLERVEKEIADIQSRNTREDGPKMNWKLERKLDVLIPRKFELKRRIEDLENGLEPKRTDSGKFNTTF